MANGERIEAPSPTAESQALSGSEIFIGGLPRSITEAEVKDSLDYAGAKYDLPRVVSVRLMKDKLSGDNKGFAFAAYPSRKDASKAAEVLNNIEIKNKRVRITISENRCRIFIGNIPKDLSKEDFMKQLTAQGEGVVNVDFLKDPDNPARNRGFAFVVYKDHPSADRAKRNLSKNSFHIGRNTITVNWADPVPEPDDDTMREVKTLYIRSLPEGVAEEALQEFFSRFGEVKEVVIPPSIPGQKRRDFCFVHFVSAEGAHNAVDPGHFPHVLQGRELEVTLAKPMDKRARDEIRQKKQARQRQKQAPQGMPAPPPPAPSSSAAPPYPYPPPARATYPPYYPPYSAPPVPPPAPPHVPTPPPYPATHGHAQPPVSASTPYSPPYSQPVASTYPATSAAPPYQYPYLPPAQGYPPYPPYYPDAHQPPPQSHQPELPHHPHQPHHQHPHTHHPPHQSHPPHQTHPHQPHQSHQPPLLHHQQPPQPYLGSHLPPTSYQPTPPSSHLLPHGSQQGKGKYQAQTQGNTPRYSPY